MERLQGAGGLESPDGSPPVTADDLVTVYWRPGCPYCAGLRRRLRRLGVRTTEVNIWEDAQAAAIVRSHAGGNETVPTVVIGHTALVNPSGAQVLEVARRLAPGAIEADGAVPRPSWLRSLAFGPRRQARKDQ